MSVPVRPKQAVAPPWGTAWRTGMVEDTCAGMAEDTCAICMAATDFIHMPCCWREAATTHFCLSCIQRALQFREVCPACRTAIVMSRCRQHVELRDFRLSSATTSTTLSRLIPLLSPLLLAAATCPSHESLRVHARATSPLVARVFGWWLSAPSIRTQPLLFVRLGKVHQRAFLGVCGSWWQLPLSSSPVFPSDGLMLHVVLFALGVCALMRLAVSEASRSPDSEASEA